MTGQRKKTSMGSTRKFTVFWPIIFISPFVICFLLFNIYPILYTFFASFHKWDGISQKVFIGIDNYKTIWIEDKNFRKSVFCTVRIILCAFPIAILLGMVLAAFLSNLKKGRQVAQTINFLPYITTPVAIGLIFSFLFDWSSGIVNKILMALGIIDEGLNWLGDAKLAYLVVAFMIIWKSSGYFMAIYLAGITSISEDIFEAAKVDGANAFVTFWKITVPLLKPITIFVVITSLISGLQLFDEPSLLFTGSGTGSRVVGGPERSCLSIVWNFYDVSFQTTSRLGYGSAIAITLFIIIVIFAMFGMRFMQGASEEDL
ncbi:MAG: sugar ABC transporter permease [Lachnospiraceae bacterium]|nr:sugar ABC transporter permease [Lachnospiraceae bacterium]